jgi:predicted  nucleic acid-binding Zn-ribbon protein
MTTLQTLCRLQAVDLEWSEKGRLYQAVREKLTNQSELEARRAAQQQGAQALAAARGALRDSELELASLSDKAKAVEKELYGDGVMSPRELEHLRKDSESLKRHIGQLEDQVLRGMTDVDEREQSVAQAQAELHALELAWAQERKTLTAQYHTLRARLQELQAAREQARAVLPGPDLALYDELRIQKAGAPLAVLKDGVCQTCHVTLPWHKARSVEQGTTIVTCEGCGRILYLG